MYTKYIPMSGNKVEGGFYKNKYIDIESNKLDADKYKH